MIATENRAMFLSYASQDADAARRICEALRQAAIEVWFDADGGLEHGDEWDAKIRRQIKECVLFIPIISANTQARQEGYFRIEWELAAQRAMGIASGVPFILPVVIDETREPEALVPDRFRAVQWTKLPGGEVPPAVQQRLLKLWSHRIGVMKHAANEIDVGRGLRTQPESENQRQTAAFRDDARQKKRVLVAAAILALVGIVSLGGFLARRSSRPTHGDTRGSAAPKAPGPVSETQKLIDQAWALWRKGEDATPGDWRLANDMCQRAVQLAPDDPEVWAVYSQVTLMGQTLRLNATGVATIHQATDRAQRAITLAPDSFEAQFALANCYRGQAATRAEAEQMFRGLLTRAPNDGRVLRSLAGCLRDLNRSDEALAIIERAIAQPTDAAQALILKAGILNADGRYTDAEAAMDQSLAVHPGPSAQLFKIGFLLLYHGNLDGAAALLGQVPPQYLLDERGAMTASLVWLWRDEPDKALAALKVLSADMLTQGTRFQQMGRGPRGFFVGQAQQLAGRSVAAQSEWRSALNYVNAQLAEKPNTAEMQYWRAYLLASLGDKAGATEALQVYEQLQGASETRVDWNTAPILVLLNRIEPVLAFFTAELKGKYATRVIPILRYDPAFASLRDDPRARAIIAGGTLEPIAPTAAVAAKADPNSVVVLPFANLSGDPAQEYFSDGLTEEILNALARERDLRVVPRTSAFSFKGKNLPLPEIARALDVAQVVEGSVQRAGNTVRIDCTLTRVSDGFAQPLPEFQREMKDASGLFALEDDVARAVVQKLTQRGTMTATGGGTSNWEAYDRFLRARALQFSHATGPSGYEAMHEYEAIVRLDPLFGLAWAQLAEVAAGLGSADGGFDMSEATRARAMEAANQAVRLAPNLADAHVARAVVCLVIEQDNAAAARELHEADRLQPFNAGLARVRAIMAAPTASPATLLELVTRAVDLDPQNTNTLTAMGQLLWRKGDFAHADEFLRRATVVGESQNAFLTRGVNWAAWTGDVRHALAIVNGCPVRFRNELFYRVLAPLYEEAGDETRAVATWETARKMAEKEIQTPGIRSAHVLILTALGHHAMERSALQAKRYFDQARQELDALLQEQPHTFNLLVRRVQWLAAQGRFSEALAALETIEPSAPGPEFHAPGNLTGLSGGVAAETEARVLAAAGKADAAIEQLKQMEAGGRAFGYALRLTPEFKALRGAPAFESMVREAEARADSMPHPEE